MLLTASVLMYAYAHPRRYAWACVRLCTLVYACVCLCLTARGRNMYTKHPQHEIKLKTLNNWEGIRNRSKSFSVFCGYSLLLYIFPSNFSFFICALGVQSTYFPLDDSTNTAVHFVIFYFICSYSHCESVFTDSQNLKRPLVTHTHADNTNNELIFSLAVWCCCCCCWISNFACLSRTVWFARICFSIGTFEDKITQFFRFTVWIGKRAFSHIKLY